MIRIAICDDEAPARERIRSMLEQYASENGREFEYGVFSSANELLSLYRSDYDVLFLDISMNGMDGMSAAREIRKNDPVVCIIFVTSMQQYALEGYSVRAFGFVTKPYHYKEFAFEVASALEQIDARRLTAETVTLRSRGQTDRVPVSDILYCEVENHSVTVHMRSGDRSYRCQMKEMEVLLSRYGFCRPHASYLVNHRVIDSIGVESLRLKNGAVIPISQHKRRAFLDEVARCLGGAL